MTKEFYSLVRDHLAPHGVAAINILPAVKLFDSNVRTLKLAFDNLDFFHSGDRSLSMSNVVVLGRLDPFTEAETLQKAAAAQERYKGFDEVMEAMPQLAAAVPDLVYLIMGDGNDRPRLEAKARDLGVADRGRP